MADEIRNIIIASAEHLIELNISGFNYPEKFSYSNDNFYKKKFYIRLKKIIFFNSLLIVEKWLDNHAMHTDVFYISLCRLQLPVVTKPGLTQHVVIT